MRSRTSETGRGLVLAASLAAGLASAAAPRGGGDDPAALLRAADAARSPVTEGIVHARLETPAGRGGVSGEIDLYVGGRDRSLCVFRSGKQKGRRVLSSGDATWLLAPGSARAIPLTPHHRLGGASFVELIRLDLAADYDAVLRSTDEEVDGVRCRVLDLKARVEGRPYPAGALWIDPRDRRPKRLRLDLASGKAALEVRFAGDRDREGRAALPRIEVKDLLAASGSPPTVVTILASESRRLDPSIFTPTGARALP